MRQIAFLILMVTAISCAPSEGKLKDEIIAAEKAFSDLSKAKGSLEAFIYYADTSVIKPQVNQYPIIGKEALRQAYQKLGPQNFELTWEPLRAEVSGNLGYTFGNYFLKTKTVNNRDTVLYGNYVSIWKKQADGSWRYVLDTGNPTPGVTKLNP